ncbi:MAG: DUF6502 family protein [Woeseiaceae bacterium]|nr:DUF6502 family protein [Woeseiaceae bacterium]
MKDTIQTQILNALLTALRPLAKALLRAGVGYREFEEISKAAFVDIATKDYGLRGRPTNISRVAVMTGLTRKEVRRLRDKTAKGESTMVVRSTPMAVILHRWYTDEGFLDQSGQPKVLAFDGPGTTFSTLVKNFGGDIPPGAMRTELKRIKAVEELDDGSLRVLKRNVSGLDVHEKLIAGLAISLYPVALAIAHNTNTKSDDESWILRTTATDRIRENDTTRLKRITADRLAEFAESIDDLFVAYETLHEGEGTEPAKKAVGIGVYYFEEDKSESNIFR